MPYIHDCWATRDWARGRSDWARGRPTDEDRGRRQAVSEAAAWERDGGADEGEPTDQSESWGSWEDAARVYERDGRAAWDPDRLDNRHQSESTETTDPGASPSTWTSDIASTGGPSAGWSSSEHAWPAGESSGWVDPSEGESSGWGHQDRMVLMAERLTGMEKALSSCLLLVAKDCKTVDTMGQRLSTLMPDASRPSSSSDCSWHGRGNLKNKVHTDDMTKIQTFADATTFLQHLHDTCFWNQQATAFVQLQQNIKGGFEASLEVFHNNYKNVNLRSAVFRCRHCGEGFAFDYSKHKKSHDPAGYEVNMRDLFRFFKVELDTEKAV
mgnify:CR=1 FL=1